MWFLILIALKEGALIWLEAGYAAFSLHGPNGIKVESLAKEIGKSKSSFYHHFADREIFIEELLNTSAPAHTMKSVKPPAV